MVFVAEFTLDKEGDCVDELEILADNEPADVWVILGEGDGL